MIDGSKQDSAHNIDRDIKGDVIFNNLNGEHKWITMLRDAIVFILPFCAHRGFTFESLSSRTHVVFLVLMRTRGTTDLSLSLTFCSKDYIQCVKRIGFKNL